jgi:hypothetical protein
MSLTATLVSTVTAVKSSSAVDVGAAGYSISERQTVSLSNGTGASQATHVWADTRTLAASATENLDLAGGLTDAFGATLTFTAIKAIRIRPASANTNNVVVGGAASNAFPLFGDATDTIALKPGGLLMIVDPSAAGYAVTAGTGDILKIANSAAGTAVTYTIEIIGEA